jgi:hypothetical protein
MASQKRHQVGLPQMRLGQNQAGDCSAILFLNRHDQIFVKFTLRYHLRRKQEPSDRSNASFLSLIVLLPVLLRQSFFFRERISRADPSLKKCRKHQERSDTSSFSRFSDKLVFSDFLPFSLFYLSFSIAFHQAFFLQKCESASCFSGKKREQ